MFQVQFQVQDGFSHDNVWPVADKPNVQQSAKQVLKAIIKKTVKISTIWSSHKVNETQNKGDF